MPEPDEYLVARIGEALAQHPDLAELHVEVRLRGDRVFLSGPVSTEARRDLVAEVVSSVAPDREICNETTVAELDEPRDAEELS